MKDTQINFIKRRLEDFLEDITGMKIKKVIMKEDDKSMEIFFK